MLFDKDKVKLIIDVNRKTTYLPGQHIVGVLRVEVLKELDVTAIRLLARGREDTSFKAKQRTGSKKTRETSTVHFEQLITFFGFSKESNRTGGASLQPGNYAYPFDIEIPNDAPLSYHCRTSAGTSQLSYILRATVDIPRGFNCKKEVDLVVLPAIAQQQYGELCNAEKMVKRNNVGLTVDPGCCGFDRDDGAAVEVTAELPHIAILPPSSFVMAPEAGLQQPPAGPQGGERLRVRLTLKNASRKARVKYVRVALTQEQQLSALGDSVSDTQTIAMTEVSPPSGELMPRCSATFEISLQLPNQFRHADEMSLNDPLPVMQTESLRVMNNLTVSFPGLGADAFVCFPEAVMLAAAVDPTNRVPRMPCFFSQPTLLPEQKLGAD